MIEFFGITVPLVNVGYSVALSFGMLLMCLVLGLRPFHWFIIIGVFVLGVTASIILEVYSPSGG